MLSAVNSRNVLILKLSAPEPALCLLKTPYSLKMLSLRVGAVNVIEHVRCADIAAGCVPPKNSVLTEMIALTASRCYPRQSLSVANNPSLRCPSPWNRNIAGKWN
jgi:hypothetical protein